LDGALLRDDEYKDSAVYYFQQSLALDKGSLETKQALKRLGGE
jgi:hypothetical protein